MFRPAKTTPTRYWTVSSKAAPLPEQPGAGSLVDLLSKAESGDYLAIMPYTAMGEDMERLLGRLRQSVMEGYRTATTLGYGPRFLHSTGQLHKGGPPSGLYLQLTGPRGGGPAIPGQPCDFATLAAAQALGDYEALTNLGRRVVRIDLGDDPLAGLQELLGRPAVEPCRTQCRGSKEFRHYLKIPGGDGVHRRGRRERRERRVFWVWLITKIPCA